MSIIYLVGCGKTKLRHPAPARDLYVGNLFQARRRYVESRPYPQQRWFVLSARYGLVAPDDVIEPYDLRLDQLTAAEREEWGWSVWEAIEMLSGHEDVVEVHAGAVYANTLRKLTPYGFTVTHPVAHMGIGQQLGWYAHRSPRQGSLAAGGAA